MTNKYMYFIANWKMFGGINSLNSLDKVIKFFKSFKKKKFIKIIYCPPNTLINLLSEKVRNSKIYVGAQNCHEKEKFGPFTGSVNTKMLKSVGAEYVIIGHSEVRQIGESNKLINQKIQSAIKLGLNKIRNKKFILIAYEPVWAIGSGFIPKPIELFKTINFIKKKLKNNKVLYGGSVNSKNIHQLNTISNIDGYLIGGASQNSKKFIDIIKKTYN